MRTTTRLWAALAVAVEDGRDQSEVAVSHGVSWPTVQRAVVIHAAPVVLVPDAGMDVKVWPHRRRFVADLTRRGVPVLVSARTCRRCTCAGSRRSARRSATVAEPSSGRTRDLCV
jgi:hypothetical protein